jgi:hypothetical protein
MDREERALFARSVQQVVASGGDLDQQLADLGWNEALEVSPVTAVGVLFPAQGAAAATSRSLHGVLAAGLGSADPVLLPALDERRPPGQVAGDRVQVSGTALGRQPDELLVPLADGLARVATADLVLQEAQGIDPALGLQQVSGEATFTRVVVTGDWDRAVAFGQRAVASELVGVGRTMLELARTHALDREQFGRPIAQFQAVRHRLAETLVALESADGLIAASWEDDSPVLAGMAKALAGGAARTASRHCQQVLAGIGFTTEHRFHLYARRTLVLDQLLGSHSTLTRELGEELSAERRLPALLPL